jgi:hypothetical protein
METRKSRKKKVAVFGDLERSLSDALDYEQGKKTALRVHTRQAHYKYRLWFWKPKGKA